MLATSQSSTFSFFLSRVIVHKINHAFSWALILCDFLSDGVFPEAVALGYEAR